MSLATGSKLGPYEVLAAIGAGGMGEVYRARDPRVGRDVAFKVSAERFSELLQSAGTIMWNGPVGVFEFEQFGEGTRAIANAIARSKAFSFAGGGYTLAAI